MAEKATSLTDDGTELELDRLEVAVDPLEAGCLHCAEQSIASRADCLASGHSRVVDGISRGPSLPDPARENAPVYKHESV
jgi:hypothetical protein